MQRYAVSGQAGVFAQARACLEREIAWLQGSDAGGVEHAALERRMQESGRELQRLLLQAYLDLRAARERRLDQVTDADGQVRRWAAAGRAATLASVFGQVRVVRIAYRRRGAGDIHLLDAGLNLPREKYSHGVREAVVRAAVAGSYDQAQDHVARQCSVVVPKRQLGAMVVAAACDVEGFYARRPARGRAKMSAAARAGLLVIQCDGKGVVVRPGALRPDAARTALAAHKLATRLSAGEKAGRKRMAQVACVYDASAAPRRAADIIGYPHEPQRVPAPGPAVSNKWLTASVARDTEEVIAEAFEQAERRDPRHVRTWVVLVDGNNHQIERIEAQAAARKVKITIVVDFVHVIEYLWKAGWCFFAPDDPKIEAWVGGMMRAVLDGHAATVAATIERKATGARLTAAQRKTCTTTCNYLLAKADYLDYPTALASGWPIATGVIEGACRHLVKDRMDLTGARWGLTGAEAVLRLRAVHANGDFDAYWAYHLHKEHQRIHASRYLDGLIPT